MQRQRNEKNMNKIEFMLSFRFQYNYFVSFVFSIIIDFQNLFLYEEFY